MKPTTRGAPLGLAGAGAVIAYLLEVGLVAAGRPSFIPPVTFPISLVVIAVLVLALGWPIREALRGRGRGRLDPFRAMRVVLLAKASVLSGSLLGGGALGIALHLVSRPVLPSGADTGATVFSLVAAAVAVAAGLLVEHWCRVPPDADDTVQGLQGE